MKTLGIKFQVAGVKEAQASLNSLKNSINNTLEANKRDIKRSWKEWNTENFGTTAQKQNLTIRQERREFQERSTYKQLTVNNRGLVLEFRLAYQDFFTRLEKLLDDKQNPNIFEKMFGFIGKPIGFAIDAILFPFQSALAGAFERMGEVQVQDFAEGFHKSMQRSLGLSFEETGADVGGIIGKSLYKVYQKSIDAVDNYVKGKLQFNLADTLIDAFKYTAKTLAIELPTLALRTHRRIQINKKAIPEARRAAGLRMIENDLPEATRQDIENNKSITLVYGGANTDRADIGKDYTARVMKPYLKGSAVIPMTRQWTNSAVDSEFQGDVRNLIKLVLSNQAAAQTFKGFISENGLNALGGAEQAELMEGLDLGGGEIDLSNINRIAEIVESLIENKDFALGKALQATFKGYNPDDVLGAAEAIALMEQFPDKELQIAGFSHGGYNALGTVDLLNRMGYDKVKGFSIGTPITGANATVNPDNFRAFMGDQDYYYKALTGLAGDQIDFPEFFELGEKEGMLHSLQGYVRGDNLRGGLQAFLGDRVSLPSKNNYGKHDSGYGYAVGELGAETALIRTLLTYLGEGQLGAVNAKEGFIFSAEETLPGYVGNLKKLGQGLKDEDTKKFHTEYIDFLETLQQELEIAEQLAAIGAQYKPVESLKKAAKIFPQMESLVKKHEVKFDSSKQSIFEFVNQRDAQEQELESAKQEAQEKEKYVFFQRKVKQQKDNIERTFQAMLGRKFTKKDESKGVYAFYNPEDYETRAFNFEGMVNWLENDVLNGASEAEKEQAQPTLDLLKNVTNNIRSVGSTGELDLATVRQAEKLLGIDLKEFNLLFKEFEKEGKTSVDVNQYKDELRSFRRNRDQILNEKKLPQNVSQSLDSARAKLNVANTTSQEEDETSDVPKESDAAYVRQDNLGSRATESTEQARQDIQEIINRYNEQLNQIIQRAGQQAEAAISSNVDLNIDVDTAYGAIKDRMSEYRNAVELGLFEQARQTGELILKSSEYLKQIFNQSGDNRRGQLTRIQNEILRGDRGSGRASVGLPEIFYTSGSTQLELDLNINNQAEEQTPDDVSSDVDYSAEEIVRLYGEYLQTIINNANAKAAQKIAKLALKPPDLNTDIVALFNALKQPPEIVEQIEEYKQAIQENRLLAAKYFGEKLLEDLQIQKSLIQQTGTDIVNNISFSETSRSQALLSSRGSIQELSNLQREVLHGGTRDLNPTGLMTLLNNPEFQRLIVEAKTMGRQARDGFDLGMNNDAETIAVSFVDTIVERILGDLDINSPSKVFQWIGEMIKAGFNSGVAGIESALSESIKAASEGADEAMTGIAESVSNLAAELADSPGLLDPLLETEGADEAVNNFFGNLITKVSEVYDSLAEQFPILGRMKDFIVSIGGEILQVLGIFSFGQTLIQFSTDALAAAMQMESLEKSIIAVSSSAADGAKNIKFVRDEARRLSIDLVAAEEAYKRILGATGNTSLEGLQTEQLFSTLATTARNRGLTTDATNRLFLGFEQVIAKGAFTAEEVRGQLSEVLGDIQGLLATAAGVPLPQLNKLMESGSLKAPEYMPKVRALLDAQNAAMGDTSGTAQAAQTRLNNSILEYKDLVGRQLQPVQKLGLNSLAGTFETLQKHIKVVSALTTGLFTTVLTRLVIDLLAVKAVTLTLAKAFSSLGTAIGFLTSAVFLKFLAQFALMSVAIGVWTNNIKLAKNAFPELEDRVEASTKRLEALRKAFDDAGKAAKDYQNNQPKPLQLNEGPEAGKWESLAGGDRWNLDNLVRNRLNNLYDRPGGKYFRYGPAGYFFKDQDAPIVTQAQKKQADFVTETGDLVGNIDNTLLYSNKAKSTLFDIAKIDARARDLQSQTMNVSAGDSAGLKKALEAEGKVLKERDELQKKTAQYQESLQSDLQAAKDTLSDLKQLDNTGGKPEEIQQRENLKKSLQQRITDLEAEKKAIDDIVSRIPKFLSGVNSLLRNSDERVQGFIGNQEDDALVNRTEAIKEALASGLSDAELELKLDNLSSTKLEDRIQLINKEIKSLEDKLGNAYIQEGVAGLERAAKKDGLELTPETLERMLTEGRGTQETEAANILLKLDGYQSILAESESGLVDLIKTNQSKLKDFNRTISDYFFRITQQIKEAQIEIERIINQIIQTNIKNKLATALSPNSESFVNQLISSTQSLLDQAASYAEKVLGQRGARIQFAGQKRSLQMELQDFARNVSGASDALAEFENRLRGGQETFYETSVGNEHIASSSTSEFEANLTNDNITALRRAIIGNESGGDFKAVNPHSGALGYGQVMPFNVPSWTQEALGKSLTPEQFLNDSSAQVKVIDYKLNKFLQEELAQGFDLNTAVRRVASTWYKGDPNLYNDTKPRPYNGHSYPSVDIYTKDILKRFKAEGGSSNNNNSSSANVAKSQASDWQPAQQKNQTKKIVFAPGHFSDYRTGTSGAFGLGVDTNGMHVSLESFATNRAVEIFAQIGKQYGFDTDVFRGERGANISRGHDQLASKENQGVYAVELHFDAPTGKSGIIPGNKYSSDGRFLHDYDEKLAQEFGSFSWNHRASEGGLSAPRNGISILELAPMQGEIEKSIRKAGRSGDYTEYDQYLTNFANRFFKSLNPNAEQLTNQAIALEEQKLNLQDQLVTEQEKESLEINLDNTFKSDRRRVENEIKERQFQMDDSIYSQLDLLAQYDYQTADSQAESSVRGVNKAFSDRGREVMRQIQFYNDEIDSLKQILSETDELLALAQSSEERQIIKEQEANAKLLLPVYEENLAGFINQEKELAQAAQMALNYVNDQNRLKREQKEINKRNTLLGQRDSILQARGTLEQQRQLKLKLEEARLEQKINEIRLNTPPGVYRDEQILNELEQSKTNKENIDFDTEAGKLDLERRLIDMEAAIDDKKAGFLSRIGFNFGADKLRKDSAVAQENNRYQSELNKAEKELAGEPDKLAEFKEKAEELNRVNLESINQQFKTLGLTVEDLGISAIQGFFTQISTNFFDGKAEQDRAYMEERLRYAEELVQLENQHKEDPGHLAHLKNRARELNEQKLDKIKNEFNGFKQVINIAGQALLEFTKQLAAMAAQYAAAKFISSVLGDALGGIGGGGKNFDGVKLNKKPKVKAFKADQGITVGKGIQSRKLNDNATNWMRDNFPGVASAWNAEGEGAQLGVFHTGEELLSRKTGEAGVYQALKRRLGFNPLQQLISNYAEGGTVDVNSNILSGISSSRPRIDLSGLSEVRGQRSEVRKTVNVHTTVVTPNADSFRLNQDQMNQDLVERMRRGI